MAVSCSTQSVMSQLGETVAEFSEPQNLSNCACNLLADNCANAGVGSATFLAFWSTTGRNSAGRSSCECCGVRQTACDCLAANKFGYFLRRNAQLRYTSGSYCGSNLLEVSEEVVNRRKTCRPPTNWILCGTTAATIFLAFAFTAPDLWPLTNDDTRGVFCGKIDRAVLNQRKMGAGKGSVVM